MAADCPVYSFLNLEAIGCPYRVLTVSSWPVYMFLRRWARWSDITTSKSFPQFIMIHTVKGSSIVDKTEVAVFLEFPCFLYDSENVGNLISGSSAFSKPSLDTWKFLIHKMLKPCMQDFKHDLTGIRDECKCPVVWAFFSTTFLGNWDEDCPFPGLWPLLGLPELLTYWLQHLDGIIL